MGITYSIFLRTDQINLDGTQTLCIRVIQNRKKKIFSLPLKIKPTDWSSTQQKVKTTDKRHIQKNMQIKEFDKRATNILHDYFIKGKFLSFEEFKNQLFSGLYDNNSFYKFVESEFKIIESEKSIEHSTLKTYKSSLDKMKKYKKELYFNEIDTSFLAKYKEFILTENNENSAKRNLRFIRSFLNRAIAKGILTEKNPFDNFTIGKETSRLIFLDSYELDKLKNIYEKKSLPANLHKTLKVFLFTCHTGLRISDLLSLKFKNIIDFQYTNKENKTIAMKKIYKKPIKTGNKTEIMIDLPLVTYADSLIEYPIVYSEKRNVFDTYTSKTLNEHLKEIATFASIDKNLSMHVARHTFATICIELGLDIYAVKEFLAHANISSTLIYAKYTNKAKVEQMEKWNN